MQTQARGESYNLHQSSPELFAQSYFQGSRESFSFVNKWLNDESKIQYLSKYKHLMQDWKYLPQTHLSPKYCIGKDSLKVDWNFDFTFLELYQQYLKSFQTWCITRVESPDHKVFWQDVSQRQISCLIKSWVLNHLFWTIVFLPCYCWDLSGIKWHKVTGSDIKWLVKKREEKRTNLCWGKLEIFVP